MIPRLGELFLVLFLVISPLFAAVAHYPVGDCDDKATHFYCGAYVAADPATRARMGELVRRLESRLSSERGWSAVAFRIRSPVYYPVSSWLIGWLGTDTGSFTVAIRSGFAVVLCGSFLLVAILCAATPLGLVPTLAILNLTVAVGALGSWLQVLPGDVVPFLTYAPRGAAALFFLAVVANFSCRRLGLAAFSLACATALHVGLGVILAAVCGGSAALVTLTERIRQAREPGQFHKRMAAFCVVFLLLVIAVVLPFGKNVAEILPVAPDRAWMLHEAPRRFVGAVLIAFSALLTTALGLFAGNGDRERRLLVAVAILAAIVHSAVSARRMTSAFAFARDPCSVHQALPLPESLENLESSNRPEVMLSLAAYLRERVNDSGGES